MNTEKRPTALDFQWWRDDPPLQAWTCEGILCAIAKGFSFINGYVQIPKDHPWYGLPYAEIDVDVHGGLTFGPETYRPEITFEQSEDNPLGPVTIPHRDGRDVAQIFGWIGFDTGHGGDWWTDEELEKAGVDLDGEEEHYRRSIRELYEKPSIAAYERHHDWTLDELVNEVNHLARQVANARA